MKGLLDSWPAGIVTDDGVKVPVVDEVPRFTTRSLEGTAEMVTVIGADATPAVSACPPPEIVSDGSMVVDPPPVQLPRPVQRSKPTRHGAPLFPEVMSRYVMLLPYTYAELSTTPWSADRAAHIGEDALVPPTVNQPVCPL